jgi:hypothetical protein
VEQLREVVERAHFRDVAIRTTTKKVRFPSAKAYVRITFAASPLAGLVGGMEAQRREELVESLASELTASLRPEPGEQELVFLQTAHVLRAYK